MKRHIFYYTAKELAPFIDWSYFLHAWGIGAHSKGEKEVVEIVEEAKRVLDKLDKKVCARAMFALCDAHSHGDNIIIEGKALPMLRQQHSKEGEPCLCLSDFISPEEDKIGLFATCAGEEITEMHCNDPFLGLVAQTVASRLAEAAATLMHRDVRTKRVLWGYAPDERLTPQELNLEKYQGIRPAVGYPSLPDQSIIFSIDKILSLDRIGITLTANGAMLPHAAVCGMMISHPASRYFAVGNITDEQLADYAARCSMPVEKIQKFLIKNIG